MTGKLTFSGGPELERALKELGGKVAGRLAQNATMAGARVIASAARAKVPVETGRLKASIRASADFERRLAGGSERTAYAGTREFYGRFVELGTAHSSAKPYLRPALDEQGQAAVDKMAENLGRGIERETVKYKSKARG